MSLIAPLPVVIAGIILLFVFSADLIALKRMRNVHIELAKLAKTLLNSDDLNNDQKKIVANMLDDVFSWWYMPFAVVILPYALLLLIANKKPSENFANLLMIEEFRAFQELHTKSVLSSNTLFSLIFFVMVLALGLIAMLCLGGYKGVKTLVDSAFLKASPNIRGSKHFAEYEGITC
jgi:hypothetical protein